ncbi:MAG TPA: EAL domain-containing protein [Roseiarcus sp.]|nr:EAL domain-containing protein [Roseiarcus sp.]
MHAKAPNELSKSAPLFEPKDIAELRRRWRVARPIGEPLPPYEELLLGSLGRIDDNIVLLASDSADWNIHRAGRDVRRWIEGADRNVRLSQLEPDFAWALSNAARCAVKNSAPHLTEAYFARHGYVQCYDILALPLANRWGPTFVAVYVGERGQRYSLVDSIFHSSDDGVVALAVIRDEDRRPIDFQIIDLNARATRLLGQSAERLRWRRLSEGEHAFASDRVIRHLYRLLEEGGGQERFELTTQSHGETIHVGVSLTLMGDLICASLADVTALKLREESYRLLFDANPMPMWIVEAGSQRFLAVNDAAIAHYGYSRDRFLEMTANEICCADLRDGPQCAPADADQSDRSCRHIRADGGEIEVLTFGRKVAYHGHDGHLVAIVDITERKRAEAEVAYLAHHDALTGLRNRAYFRDHLGASIDLCRRKKERLAVCCVDLDLFKEVNDTFGHPTGDRLLRMVALRLAGALSEGDLAARLGGDEFAVILNQVASPSQVGDIVSELIELLSRTYTIDGLDIAIGASIGIALFPDDGLSADELIKNADMALYQAKSEGRSRHHFFQRDMDRKAQERRALEADLRNALTEGQLELHYQPLVDISGNRVSGFEALLRWRHPTKGMIPPSDFIPIAEATGLIIPIGEWVLRTACVEAATWRDGITVAVNLSAIQFRALNLVNAVIGALAHSGLAPERLELEITETVLLAETETTLATLHKLRDFGVRIALDDFGTGYSSLSYLRGFPFDKIKIDRSFVKDLSDRVDCTAIISAISSLAKSLGIATTAEGVETQQQLDFLRLQGCTQAQGFLFSPAMPRANLAELVGKINRHTDKAA